MTGTASAERQTIDFLTELGDAAWDGHVAQLRALAAAGGGGPAQAHRRRQAADDALRALEDVLADEVVDAMHRVWRRVGLALVALGHAELWPAVYALSDLCERAGRLEDDLEDARAFLADGDLPAPDPPAGGPRPWLARP